MNLNQNPENEELNNIKIKVITALTFGYITTLIFLIAFLVFEYFLQIHIYNELYFLVLGWLTYSYLIQYILKKRRIKLKLIKRIYFINYIVGLLFMTAIFYYMGGILWIGVIFFVFIILYASILSPPREGLIITLITFTCYNSIVLLEYLELIPYKEFFRLTPYLYKDSQYIVATTLVLGLVFFLIFITGKSFAQKLKQKSAELVKTKEELEEWSDKLEKKIEERTQELSQTQTQLFQTSKLATLGEMSAGLAHEINQPLTGISLITMNIKKLMERGLLTEKETKENIQEISDNVKRMSNIVTHIRAFARQDIHNFIQVNVNECIKKALGLLGEQLRLHDIKIIKELDYNLPMIEGEPYQIEQVIINIISNARDALDDKGRWDKKRLKNWSKTITIKTAMEKNCEKGDCACIYVSDNGTGMSPKVKQRMFEPFFTTKEVGKATGLGISISYGIVQSHKGRIDVETEKGEGTIVSIKFSIKMKEQ